MLLSYQNEGYIGTHVVRCIYDSYHHFYKRLLIVRLLWEPLFMFSKIPDH